MISFLFVILMAIETTFMDAQAKYRSTLDTLTHRKIDNVPVYRRRI